MARRSYLLRDPAPLSWALWDFAYSVFSFLLVVRYFGTWVIDDLGRPDWYVAMTQFVVVLFLLGAIPLGGALRSRPGWGAESRSSSCVRSSQPARARSSRSSPRTGTFCRCSLPPES